MERFRAFLRRVDTVVLARLIASNGVAALLGRYFGTEVATAAVAIATAVASQDRPLVRPAEEGVTP